jgi:hypothetical protein
MPIRPFIQSGVFEPETVAAMREAFEAACKELDDTGQPQIAPDVIAGRIIAAARIGERDPVLAGSSAGWVGVRKRLTTPPIRAGRL